jgi:hypothetical protein
MTVFHLVKGFHAGGDLMQRAHTGTRPFYTSAAHGQADVRDYAEGLLAALLVGVIVAAYALGGGVVGTVTAVLIALAVIIVLLVRIADSRGR